jgi:branched-subunit amino acid ABC-type transport system permease component
VSPITWLDYQLGGFFMLNGILAYLIGGEEDVAGPLVGGLLLGVVQNIFLLIPGTAGGLLKQVVPMLILIFMLVFRPQGLLPPRRA